MKVLIDMNLSPRLAALLSGAGFEATHWSTLGPKNASDRQIMAYAKERDLIVLTHDLDLRRHHSHERTPGRYIRLTTTSHGALDTFQLV